MQKKTRIKAILLMGGTGSRFGSTRPKQFLHLSGIPIYQYALKMFCHFPHFSEILLVVHPQWISYIDLPWEDSRIRIVPGGTTRQESSYLGLLACGKNTDYVVIHDAVRPLLPKSILQDHLSKLSSYDAINTCIPSTDTLVHLKDPHTIDSIPNRAEFFCGQTPQTFSYSLLLQAHQATTKKHFSDDCSLITEQGKAVHVVLGSPTNIKITTQLDLFTAEQLLSSHPPLSHHQERQISLLKGKVFAITGGTGGIGAALSTKLRSLGARPLIISLSSRFYPVDLTSPQQTEELFRAIYEKHGRLDGLINCVGSLTLRPFHSLTIKEIDRLISTNLHALLYTCRYAKIKPKGHIINLASSAFTRGRKSYVLYSSAKAAIVNFTQGLAEECPELSINVIVPQRTNTSLRKTNFPKEDPNLLLSPEEVAEHILLLLQKSHQTGTIVEVRKN